MNVKVIKKANIRDHIGTNKQMLKYFEDFFRKLDYVHWRKPQDITQVFKSADLITCKGSLRSRVVFNIGRNRFRLICGYWFREFDVILYVKFVGTHKEYDSIDPCRVEMFN